MEDSHAKVDNVTVAVGVIVVVEDVLKEGDEREREESILDDDAVVEVVNGIKNVADDNDGVLLCKRGQSRRALHQWRVHKGVSILRETRSLERDLCPDFPFKAGSTTYC